jgi:hypothetical protein
VAVEQDQVRRLYRYALQCGLRGVGLLQPECIVGLAFQCAPAGQAIDGVVLANKTRIAA